MIALALDHLWQSTLVLGVIGLMTLFFRRNGADVRHGLWVAASLKFLVPFAALSGLGMAAARLARWPASPPPVTETVFAAVQPFSDRALLPAPDAWLPALLALWLAGMTVMAGLWLSRWLTLRAVLRAARAADLAAPMPVRIAPAQMEPGLVGVFRPVLLLPEGIMARLTAEELRAVIAHEACHMRRHDNLLAMLHMLVQAVFWFWPPLWWLGARLVAERENACDEAVLAAGNDPETYAEGILKVCKFYVSSPLACAAGIAGANLSLRMETIMENRIVARMNGMKKLMLGTAAVALVTVPVATGLLWSPAAMAQGKACSIVPLMQTHTPPPYPGKSRDAGEAGVVLLRVTIAKDGHPSRTTIAKSSGFSRLDQASSEFVQQQYRWKPLSCGSVQTDVKVVWSLANPEPLRPGARGNRPVVHR